MEASSRQIVVVQENDNSWTEAVSAAAALGSKFLNGAVAGINIGGRTTLGDWVMYSL